MFRTIRVGAAMDNKIRCTDGCGKTLLPEEAETAGWTYLSIANRWRCPACRRELATANEMYAEQEQKTKED